MAEVCAVKASENVVHSYCDEQHYRDGGRFVIRLHFEIKALRSFHLSSIRLKYEGGKYPVVTIRQWLDYEERKLEEERLGLPIYLEKGKTLDVQIVAHLLCEGEPGHYSAVDYGSLCIEIDADEQAYVVDGAICRGGVLLLGDRLAEWQGAAALA